MATLRRNRRRPAKPAVADSTQGTITSIAFGVAIARGRAARHAKAGAYFVIPPLALAFSHLATNRDQRSRGPDASPSGGPQFSLRSMRNLPGVQPEKLLLPSCGPTPAVLCKASSNLRVPSGTEPRPGWRRLARPYGSQFPNNTDQFPIARPETTGSDRAPGEIISDKLTVYRLDFLLRRGARGFSLYLAI